MTALDDVGRAKAVERMRQVDAMPPAVRALVHEFGLTMVDQFLRLGITNPRHIRHLICAVRRGSVEIGNRSMSAYMRQEADARMVGTLRAIGYTVIPPRHREEPPADG